jgi:hypothetical protein
MQRPPSLVGTMRTAALGKDLAGGDHRRRARRVGAGITRTIGKQFRRFGQIPYSCVVHNQRCMFRASGISNSVDIPFTLMLPIVGGLLMNSKLSLAVAVALAALVAVPSASYAASKKHKAAETSETGLTNPSGCLGGGCTSQNPDRVTQPCNGSNCYKRSSKKAKSSSSSPQ